VKNPFGGLKIDERENKYCCATPHYGDKINK
jgi:hypothetical protein